MGLSVADIRDFVTRVSVTGREDVESFLANISATLRESLAAPGPQTPLLFTSVQEALRNLPADIVTVERVECLLDLARYFYVSGQPQAGLEPAADAATFARRLGDKSLLRKAQSLYGVMLADTGNLPGAIECYAEALELAAELQDATAELPVWNNLGVAFIYAAQYGDAILCLERAISLCGENPALAPQRAQAFGNIALACLHLEDFAKGLRSAKVSVETGSEPKTAADLLTRVIHESHYTRLLLEVNGVDRARERCEIAKRYAKQSRSERAELMAALAEGLYEVHAGMIDIGLSRLTQALDRARIMKSALRDALVAMVKAHEVAGKPDLALVYLRELMLHTKKVQQDNALLHHRLHLEKLEQAQAKKDQAQESLAEQLLERREDKLRGQLAEQVAQQEVLRARIEMLERLAVTAELRDDATGEHSYRVGRLAALLAQEYGCDEQTCFMIDLAARLHDIGKIGTPDGILLKNGRLNEAERQIMQTHTNVGGDILAKSNIPHLQMAEEIARFHHEWWNGSGYPFGIGGTAIPLSARIAGLVDVFDALTHKRPYKDAWPVDKALEEIAAAKGVQFDPHLTDLFLALIPRLQGEVGDLDEYLGRAARSSPFLQAREKIAATLRQYSARRFDTQK